MNSFAPKSGVSIPLFFIGTLFFVFSFINPNHRWPWTSFHSEAAAIIALSIIAITQIKNNIYLNRFHFICLFFILAIIICWATGLNYFKSSIFIGLLYITFACMAFSLGNTSKENQILINIFSLSLIISFLISFSFQIIQLLELQKYYDPWITNGNGSKRYSGNIGQPNHIASLAATSLILSVYLFNKKELGKNTLVAISLIVGISLQISGSRTGILALTILLLIIYYKKNLRSNSKYIIYTFSSYFFTSYLNRNEKREYLENSISAGRFEIWEMLFRSAIEKPWLGYGFNETIEAHFAMLGKQDISFGITAHAHNLFLDLIVWFGFPIGIIISIVTIHFFANYYSSIVNKDIKLLQLSTIPLATHAMLEFPLHYIYFLAPFSFIIGASTEDGFYKIRLNFLKYFFLISIVFSLFLLVDYLNLEQKISDQRFYLSNFEKSKIQEEHRSWVLDAQSTQYNYLTRDINAMEETELENLIKIYPTAKNFHSICLYLKGIKNEKFNFYREKGENYLKGDELIIFKKAFPSNL